jgi:alpha-tubulin suppressor-like RCC1 family protein
MDVERQSGLPLEKSMSLPHLPEDPTPESLVDSWLNVIEANIKFRSFRHRTYTTQRTVELETLIGTFQDFYRDEDDQSDFEFGVLEHINADAGYLELDKISTLDSDQIKGVSIGETVVVIIRSDNRAWCQGLNFFGQLGDGTREERDTYVPTSLIDVVQVAAGDYHVLALKSNGTVWAWGRNNYGQVGNNSYVPQETPVQVLDSVTGIAAGSFHSIAFKNDGSVYTWGWNGSGQLGRGTLEDRLIPTAVPAMTNVVAVSGGYRHSLLVKSDGSVWGAGSNKRKQLSDAVGVAQGQDIVVKVFQRLSLSVLTNVIKVSAGRQHSIALKSNNSIWCWGDNHYEQLCRDKDSVASGIEESITPLQVFESNKTTPVYANKIIASWWSGLIYDTTYSKLRGWGSNGWCQLGFWGSTYPTHNTFDSPQNVSLGTSIETWGAGGKNIFYQRVLGGPIYKTISSGAIRHGLNHGQFVPTIEVFGSVPEDRSDQDSGNSSTLVYEGSGNPSDVWYTDFSSYELEGSRVAIYDLTIVGITDNPRMKCKGLIAGYTKLFFDVCISFNKGATWSDWITVWEETPAKHITNPSDPAQGEWISATFNSGFFTIPQIPLSLPINSVYLKAKTRFYSRGCFSPQVTEFILDVPNYLI